MSVKMSGLAIVWTIHTGLHVQENLEILSLLNYVKCHCYHGIDSCEISGYYYETIFLADYKHVSQNEWSSHCLDYPHWAACAVLYWLSTSWKTGCHDPLYE